MEYLDPEIAPAWKKGTTATATGKWLTQYSMAAAILQEAPINKAAAKHG